MSRKKISQANQKKTDSPKSRRAVKSKGVSLPLRYRFLILACCSILILGFFFAARQHFASMDFSMKNSRLREMSEELESDKRRLLLAKEIALSPAEIKKAAQKIGFTTKTITGSNNNAAAPLRPAVATAAITTAANDNQPKPRTEKSETAKLKQTITDKATELVADVKSAVKKATETKSPDVRARREPTQAER